MLDEETYKKELVRMWDSSREYFKGHGDCSGVKCKECPLHEIGCGKCGDPIEEVQMIDMFKIINVVERWSKEHLEKHKVSKLEYDILDAYTNLFDFGDVKMLNFSLFDRLHGIGYFKGVTKDMYIKDYFNNCEVEENDG